VSIYTKSQSSNAYCLAWDTLLSMRSSSASTVCAVRRALRALMIAPQVENSLSTLADDAGMLRNLQHRNTIQCVKTYTSLFWLLLY